MVNSVGPIYDETDSGWDPLHRLINDMKHAMTFGPKDGTHWLETALLCSSYVFSLNYKPYKGGSFHADKRELLDHFLRTMTEDHSDLNSTFPESALV